MDQITQIFLVRHAECEGQGYTGRRSNVPLNSTGLNQSQKLREWFESVSIDIAISSPLVRATKTCEIILKQVKSDMILSEDLEEIDFGFWDGKTYEELQQSEGPQLQNWIQDPINNAPPGGESLIDLSKRVLPAFSTFVEQNAGKNVLIVSHGGPLRLIICSILGLHIKMQWSFSLNRASISKARFYPLNQSVLDFLNFQIS